MLLTLKQISHTLLLPTFKNHGNLRLSVPPQCHPPLQMRPCARLLTTTFVRDTHPFFRIRKKSLHVENKPKPQRERIVSQPPFFIPNHHFSEAGCCYPSSNLSKLTCNWEFVGLQMFKQFHLSLPNGPPILPSLKLTSKAPWKTILLKFPKAHHIFSGEKIRVSGRVSVCKLDACLLKSSDWYIKSCCFIRLQPKKNMVWNTIGIVLFSYRGSIQKTPEFSGFIFECFICTLEK